MKSGGEAGEEGRQGSCVRGWVDGGLASVGKFFSVEFVELLDRALIIRKQWQDYVPVMRL